MIALLLACAEPEPPPKKVVNVERKRKASKLPMAPAHPGTGLTEEQFAALHSLTAATPPTPKGKVVTIDGTAMYLSMPQRAPTAAVVVIHEWWGLNEHIKHWTDRLAADGYAALAVDLYGGRVATTREDALATMKKVDRAKALKTLEAAHHWLRTSDEVGVARTGVVGWCFGGGWSLRLAMQERELDAAVVYYGRLDTDPAQLAGIRAPVLGVFGTQDAGIPNATVDAFEAALKDQGKSVEIHRYDAQHAFANPSSAAYDAVAAADAWKHVRRFLRENL